MIKPILAMLFGALLLLFAKPIAGRMDVKRHRRLAELSAGAEERFFEERRSLEAYSSTANRLRLLGVALIVLGGGMFALSML